MRHRKKRNTLSKPADQRKALIKSLMLALISNEKIKTTHRRAKVGSVWADKLVTFGKKGDINSRRQAYKLLQDRSSVKKLFDDIAPRFKDINGGYTRVLKVDNRRGDNALISVLEFTKIKEEIIEGKINLKRMRRERKEKSMHEDDVAPVVEEVQVVEEKNKKEVKKKSDKLKKEQTVESDKKKQDEEQSEEKPKVKPQEVKEKTEKEDKGFLQGLKGFLKSKKEK
ncbi:MAG: 50S ribosomal protein L17 [Candidatus Saelkia tenebricola]|nr:50S ribosomal protein L17 [Candidatus Saelkia tenebricola]